MTTSNPSDSPFRPPENVEEMEQLLTRAAALEHALLSAYLFTSYTLKQDRDEIDGYQEGDLEAANAWSGMITGVAVQEMLHLALACNMLSAIGCTPEFRREDLNFPIDPSQMERVFGYRGAAYLSLWPFSVDTIERFRWFEHYVHDMSFPPPDWDETAPATLAADADAGPVFPLVELEAMNISSLVQLYQAIAHGFVNLGPALFTGAQTRQVTDLEVTGLFNFPPAKVPTNGGDGRRPLLSPVTDVRSALVAINTIIVQGEGSGDDDWIPFMQGLCAQAGLDYADFPVITSPSHYATFDLILNGNGSVPGLLHFEGYERLVRPVPENPLVNDPCGADPACAAHVHLIDDPTTAAVADLFDELYGVMIDLLVAGFAQESDSSAEEPDQSDEDYWRVRTYGKATLIQASIRSMVYLMSPVANALTQLPGGATGAWNAGPGFLQRPRAGAVTLAALSQELGALSQRFADLARGPVAAAGADIWVRPEYFDVPPAPAVPPAIAGHTAPRYSLSDLLLATAADLLFLGERLARVEGHAPPVDPETGQHYPQHVCYGLNSCRGQDITGAAPAAGAGVCATADPHVCSGQNHCAGQGGCGFSPGAANDLPAAERLQDHPGANLEPGQIKTADGYWMVNPDSDSACGSPIMPSIRNTFGPNTPAAADRGGDDTYDEADGYVWELARLVFEARNGGASESDFHERYRAPFQAS